MVAVAWIAVVALALAGCGEPASELDRAEAQVTAKEKALAQAQTEFADASAAFCDASKTYILALDRYGDLLNDTAPTVGDVRTAGADLADPSGAALDSATAAAEAQQSVLTAEQELADAQTELQRAQAGSTEAPDEIAVASPSASPLAPAASVDRVAQAESEFADAQAGITDETPMTDATEQFNSAAVALEMAWLKLYADSGCVADEQKQAQAAVAAYTTALQQDLATAGHYAGAVDGVYGPATVAAVEALQKANGLQATGTVDKATAEALQAELLALGGETAQQTVATTAAVQQTLALAGFWDGPVDGTWTPALTEALQAFQIELGVEPTGTVDAATIAAFEKALGELQSPESTQTPSPEPTAAP